MSNRSAVDTIKGYLYQFDMSIGILLELTDPNDTVALECIEDIDIRTATETSAIQCKYYSKTEYNHSVIKDAIQLMLEHFRQVKNGDKAGVNYIIRGHYSSGHDKLDGPLDTEYLKKHFLTYTENKVKRYRHVELGFNDAELDEFLTLLTIDIRSLDFDVQFRAIIQHIKAAFNCSEYVAEYFYYNNALRVIRELAIQSDVARRTISKKAFLTQIDTASALFNEWFLARKGAQAHFSALRKEFFTSLNVSPFERFFLLDTDPSNYKRTDIKDLIFVVARKWGKTHKNEPNPFCPYIFIQGISASELIELKSELHAEGLRFIDGHDYMGAQFSANSIRQRATYGNGIRIKILNTLANMEDTLSSISATRKIYQFHIGLPYWNYEHAAVSHEKIHIQKTTDIKEII